MTYLVGITYTRALAHTTMLPRMRLLLSDSITVLHRCCWPVNQSILETNVTDTPCCAPHNLFGDSIAVLHLCCWPVNQCSLGINVTDTPAVHLTLSEQDSEPTVSAYGVCKGSSSLCADLTHSHTQQCGLTPTWYQQRLASMHYVLGHCHSSCCHTTLLWPGALLLIGPVCVQQAAHIMVFVPIQRPTPVHNTQHTALGAGATEPSWVGHYKRAQGSCVTTWPPCAATSLGGQLVFADVNNFTGSKGLPTTSKTEL